MADEETREPADGQSRETPDDNGAIVNTGAGIDLARVRDLVLAAHPDVVPEMVQGTTFDELMSSVEPARDAYDRVASQATEEAGSRQSAPRVAAQPGQRGTALVDIESLSPLGKISEGLRRR